MCFTQRHHSLPEVTHSLSIHIQLGVHSDKRCTRGVGRQWQGGQHSHATASSLQAGERKDYAPTHPTVSKVQVGRKAYIRTHLGVSNLQAVGSKGLIHTPTWLSVFCCGTETAGVLPFWCVRGVCSEDEEAFSCCCCSLPG